MNAVISWLATLLYPDRCCVCGKIIPWRRHMCNQCQEEAPFVLPPVCVHCGRGENRCSCGGRERSFARCVMPFYYENTMHTGIFSLKDGGYRPYVEGMSREMAEVIRREYGGIAFDFITAVPLYYEDERLRGFNPAALLAMELAQRMELPYIGALRKRERTTPQKELTASLRSGNLLGVFDVTAEVTGKTVLLVDDVITTGATLDECAKMLKLYGAKEVYAVTAAGAVLQKEEK